MGALYAKDTKKMDYVLSILNLVCVLHFTDLSNLADVIT